MMKFPKGSLVIIPDWSIVTTRLAQFLNILKYVIDLSNIENLFLSLGIHTVHTFIFSVRRATVIPSSSIIVRLTNEEQQSKIKFSLTRFGFLKIIELSDDEWIDSKPLINCCIKVLNTSHLSDEIREFINYINGYLECEENHTCCTVINDDSGVDADDYLRNYIKSRHILIAKSIINNYEEIEGDTLILWPHHAVMYGLNFPDHISTKVYSIEELPMLSVLSRPLAFIGDYPIILDIPFNNSIIISAELPHELISIVLVKSIMYTC